MDLSALFRPISPMQELDDIIGEDMQDSWQANGETYGPVKFKPTTLDALLQFADSEERDDGNCSLTGFVLRKLARMLYEGGEDQDYATVLNIHRDVRALLEISKEMESSYSWKRSGYNAAATTAELLGLPLRAKLLREHLDKAAQYHDRIPDLHAECPCYNIKEMAEQQYDFNQEDVRPAKGAAVAVPPPPVEA